jgi:cytochrome P450
MSIRPERRAVEPISTMPDLPAESEPAHGTLSASVLDTLRVVGTVLVPTVGIGVIKRRAGVMGWAEKLHLDRAAIATMRSLRVRYGHRTVRLRIPGRSVELPLSAEDVGRVLAGTPDPFSTSTKEKSSALGHFQPHGVLVSRGGPRADRRRFNEQVLRPEQPLHQFAPAIVSMVREEARELLREVDSSGERSGQLGWEDFNRRWWSMVRRIVLGEGARDDHGLTDLLDSLRLAGNWAYLRPRNRQARQRFLNDVADYVRRAERGSLAAEVARTPAEDGVDPAGQVPHWLFAFDAAGIVTFRTLALLAGHPRQNAEVREELRASALSEPAQLPYLRACVLESVRLWPTTPALLRESTRDSAWGPAHTTSFIFTPFFHRDADTLSYADTFTPQIWLDGTAKGNPALVPFSAGAGGCPGRNIVLLTASTMLAALLEHHDVTLLDKPGLSGERRLPATLDNFGTRFGVARH